jgi:hypothetical protein
MKKSNCVLLIARMTTQRNMCLGKGIKKGRRVEVHWVYKHEMIWQKEEDLLLQCEGRYERCYKEEKRTRRTSL